MFDAETAALIRSAPPLRGVDPQTLPQELTAIYAELAGLRLRATELADAPDNLAQVERLARIAAVYEAQVDDTIEGETRRAAAFVAGTAYQILSRVLPTSPDRSAFLSAGAIHPRIAAPLLFLIAEQSPDAREAARGLGFGRLEDIHRGALLESIQDLAQERFASILERAERLSRLQPSPEADLTEQATQGLYGLCWAGIVHLVVRLLDQAPPALAYPLLETPQALFDRVTSLAVANVAPGAVGATSHASCATSRTVWREPASPTSRCRRERWSPPGVDGCVTAPSRSRRSGPTTGRPWPPACSTLEPPPSWSFRPAPERPPCPS